MSEANEESQNEVAVLLNVKNVGVDAYIDPKTVRCGHLPLQD